VPLAALVAEAELNSAARQDRVACFVDAPIARLDSGGGRCGGALGAVKALEVGTNLAPEADLSARLKPVIRLAHRAL
jgi:hypothetical protein